MLDEHLALQLKEAEKQAEAEKLAKIKEELKGEMTAISLNNYRELENQMQEMQAKLMKGVASQNITFLKRYA